MEDQSACMPPDPVPGLSDRGRGEGGREGSKRIYKANTTVSVMTALHKS